MYESDLRCAMRVFGGTFLILGPTTVFTKIKPYIMKLFYAMENIYSYPNLSWYCADFASFPEIVLFPLRTWRAVRLTVQNYSRGDQEVCHSPVHFILLTIYSLILDVAQLSRNVDSALTVELTWQALIQLMFCGSVSGEKRHLPSLWQRRPNWK